MRAAAVLRLLSAVLAVVFVVAFTAPVAQADGFSDCVQVCIDNYDRDKTQCDADLAQRLAELDKAAQDCIANNPTDPIAAQLCLRDVNIDRFRAQASHRRCISIANTVAYNCYLECQASGSQP